MGRFWKLRQPLDADGTTLAVLLALVQAGCAAFAVWFFSTHSVYFFDEGGGFFDHRLANGYSITDSTDTLPLTFAGLALLGGIAVLIAIFLQRASPPLARGVIAAGALLALPLSVWLWQFIWGAPTSVPGLLVIVAIFAPFQDRSAGPYDDFIRKPPDKIIL